MSLTKVPRAAYSQSLKRRPTKTALLQRSTSSPAQALAGVQRAAAHKNLQPQPHDILALQQMAGNRSIQRFIQAKLTVGAVNDPLEQEADRVADGIVKQSARRQVPGVQTMPVIQRVGEDECEELRSKAAPDRAADGGFPVSPAVEQNLAAEQGRGSPLTDNVRQEMESGIGADFSQVRVHTDQGAVQLSQDLQAQAFTHGQDIYFGANKFNPSTSEGKHLLAHELTHVVQQTGQVQTKAVQRQEGGIAAALGSAWDSITAAVGGVVSSIKSSYAERMAELRKIARSRRALKKMAETTSVQDMMFQFRLAGISFQKRFKFAMKYWSPVTFADLQPEIELADQKARDAVWKSGRLMGLAKRKLSVQDYLSLLPALRVFKKGKTKEDKKSHTKADKADQYIRTYLGTYVAEAVKAGKKVEGWVAVVDGKDWELAYEKEFGDDGEQDITNAFVDHPPDGSPGRIWIHKNRGNAGTIIHEGVHKYSQNAVIGLSQPFNEGVTEYFTRLICKKLTPPITRGNYESNYEVVKVLADKVGEEKLAKAYFDGDVAGLKAAFLASGKTATQWADFLAKTRGKNWSEAEGILNAPATEEAPAAGGGS